MGRGLRNDASGVLARDQLNYPYLRSSWASKREMLTVVIRDLQMIVTFPRVLLVPGSRASRGGRGGGGGGEGGHAPQGICSLLC